MSASVSISLYLYISCSCICAQDLLVPSCPFVEGLTLRKAMTGPGDGRLQDSTAKARPRVWGPLFTKLLPDSVSYIRASGPPCLLEERRRSAPLLQMRKQASKEDRELPKATRSPSC